jgi:response regulator RpfG family c-di-GMP phosphodiesterase
MAEKTRTADHTVLKVLLDRGAITADLYEGTLNKQKAYGGAIEELLLDSGIVDENTLLNTLAAHFKTKFVLSEKLKDATFDESVLKTVPEKVLRAAQAFPIAFDPKSRTLSVITARPDDIVSLSEVEKASMARKVVPYLARPAAVRAAIARWFDRDIHAFDKLRREDVEQFHQMMDVYERNVLDETTIAAAAVKSDSEESTFSAEDLEKRSAIPVGESDAEATRSTGENFLNTLHIMMGLLENDRAELRGHSVQVSRHMRQMAERIRLSDSESVALGIAGAIHDLGKFGLYHLTALNVAEWQGHWEAAASRYTVPTRLFESVQLPLSATQAVDHMYERFAGSGFPEGLKGKDIPLSARILAIVDTYSDLTLNPKNPFRKVLTPTEAAQVFDNYREAIFDPMLVDVFKSIVAGDALRDTILAGQNSILIVDSDPEQAIILELNLVSNGFSVEVCSNSRAGMQAVMNGRADLVITEVDLKPIDGFDMVDRLRADERFKDLPVLFYTFRSDQKDVSRGFELGAMDYMVKPSSVDVVVAKVQRGLQARAAEAAPAAAGGVSGSLSEMDLPDLVQVLSQGRKTGALKIQSSTGNGEIHFDEGRLVNVVYKDREGEEAFYEMLHIKDGRFQVDAAFKPERQTIQLSAESLLLEGMRRLDEANR